MSDDERHSNICEPNSSNDMANNPESTKIKGCSRRMEKKQEKPKRPYKKKIKPAATEETLPNANEKPGRDRITKRNVGASKKRTKPTKPSLLEEAISVQAGRELPRAFAINASSIYPIRARFLTNGEPTRQWDQPAGLIHDESDESDSDDDDTNWTTEIYVPLIYQKLMEIYHELLKHTPKN